MFKKNKQQKTMLWLKLYAILITFAAIFVSIVFFINYHTLVTTQKSCLKADLEEQPSKINWAVVGWNNTLEKLGYDSDIVFLGDSITRGSDFRDYFPNKKIVNLGYSGDNLSRMTERVSMIKAVSPEQVFIMGGINGLKDFNINQCIEKYSSLLDLIIAAVPNAKIYIQSVLPISSSEEEKYCHNKTIVKFNDKLKKLALKRGVTYIDLYSLYELNGEMDSSLTKDGVHIWPEAYERWAEVLRPYIK